MKLKKIKFEEVYCFLICYLEVEEFRLVFMIGFLFEII